MKLLLTALLLLATAAQAQTVWRCGPESRPTYSDSPCPEGRAVTVADPRSTQAQAEGRQVVARDRALARQLKQERVALQRENAAPGNGLAGIRGSGPAPVVKPKAKAKEKKPSPAAGGTSPSAARAFPPHSG